MGPSLNIMLQDLAQMRQHLAHLESEWAEIKRDNASLRDEIEVMAQKVADLEETIKATACEVVKTYRDNPCPHPAVTVRKVRVPAYNKQEALAWAIRHNRVSLLKLKSKRFEEELLGGLSFDMPGDVTEDFEAVIAENLGPLLE